MHACVWYKAESNEDEKEKEEKESELVKAFVNKGEGKRKEGRFQRALFHLLSFRWSAAVEKGVIEKERPWHARGRGQIFKSPKQRLGYAGVWDSWTAGRQTLSSQGRCFYWG